MALISLRQLLDHAAEHAMACPQCQCEQTRAIMEAAARLTPRRSCRPALGHGIRRRSVPACPDGGGDDGISACRSLLLRPRDLAAVPMLHSISSVQ